LTTALMLWRRYYRVAGKAETAAMEKTAAEFKGR
jgi:hypothetical protein